MPDRPLTPAQMRVLLVLNREPTKIHPMLLLDSDRRLEPDDIVVVPSLVESGYVHFYRHCAGVSLAHPGRLVAEEHLSRQPRSRFKPPFPFGRQP
jgi:hypothetical protein